MLRFRLGRIPVDVHSSHLIVSAVFAFLFLPKSPGPHWPERVLGDPTGAGYLPALLVYLALWVGIIFVSVLVHELGHAVISLAFGYHPRIELVSLGGNTHPHAPGPIPWHKDVLLTLAGPVFGLLLAGLCYGVRGQVSHDADVAQYVLRTGYLSNLVWSVYNLVPVNPLDGGRVASALLQRVFGRRGFLFAQVLSLGVCAGLILLLLGTGQVLVVLFMGLYAVQAVRAIAGYLRGELPVSPEAVDAARALQRAREAAAAGRPDEATALAEAVAQAEGPAALKAEAHQLLGEAAVRAGRGREALDHFSQVHGRTVAPRWLAAGFSLVGDERRALPFWELAAREEQDRTVLHEYAGALLRAGDEERVRRLTGVDLAVAWGCAERVHFLRGEYPAAAEAADRALALTPTAGRAYDAACDHARAGHREVALERLDEARRLGFVDASHAAADEDLASLRGNAGFERWLNDLRDSAKG